MSTTTLRTAALAVSAAALALLVTACGEDAESTATPPSAPSAAPSSPAGESAASVDGKALDATFDTTCAKQGDTLALALTDNANGVYGQLSVSATITGDTVQAVGIAGTEGGASGAPYAVGYGDGQPGGSAKLTRDGDTFTVTGEGVGAVDLANPLAGPRTAAFAITFACSDIVGA